MSDAEDYPISGLNQQYLPTIADKDEVMNAISQLGDRTGSSIIAINKFLQEKLPKDKKWMNSAFLEYTLKTLAKDGYLVQVTPSFKISPKAKTAAFKPKIKTKQPEERRGGLPTPVENPMKRYRKSIDIFAKNMGAKGDESLEGVKDVDLAKIKTSYKLNLKDGGLATIKTAYKLNPEIKNAAVKIKKETEQTPNRRLEDHSTAMENPKIEYQQSMEIFPQHMEARRDEPPNRRLEGVSAFLAPHGGFHGSAINWWDHVLAGGPILCLIAAALTCGRRRRTKPTLPHELLRTS